MRPHLRYLRYCLLHKLYVFIGGIAVRRARISLGEQVPLLPWVWRLLVHDLSKFRPSEWTPYVAQFYGPQTFDPADADETVRRAETRFNEQRKQVDAAFNYAWLLHQHRNPHHWQHWILREDSGRTFLLTPPAWIADEMLADWLGAGTKILSWPTVAEIVGLTVKWYMENRTLIQLREAPRQRIEATLHAMAAQYGLVDMAYQVREAQRARQSIEVAR